MSWVIEDVSDELVHLVCALRFCFGPLDHVFRSSVSMTTLRFTVFQGLKVNEGDPKRSEK